VRLRQPKRQKDKAAPLLPEEVDALLDYRGGLADYHRDDPWHEATIAHFQFNLFRMVEIAQQHNVPVMLINPPYNLKDTPPFKYDNGPEVDLQQRERFAELWQAAQLEEVKVAQRIALLQQAVAIDPRHAAVRFHLGRCLLSQQQYDAAKKELVAAKDEDICPLRILSPMRAVVQLAADCHHIPIVDAQQLFEQLTPDGITGDEWLVDHVHPSMKGHQRLASAIFEQMQTLGWVRPQGDWQQQCDARFLEHLQSLDAMYYIRGQQRLEGLLKWTQGRASRIRPQQQSQPDNTDRPVDDGDLKSGPS
jgi:hypothetical protein